MSAELQRATEELLEAMAADPASQKSQRLLAKLAELRGAETRQGEYDYRQDPLVQSIAKQHGMTLEEARDELEAFGFR